MIRQRLVAGVVSVTALVTLAACGSSTKSSSTTKSASTNASAATTGASAASAGAGTSGSEATSGTEPTSGTSGGAIGVGAATTTAKGGTKTTTGTTPDAPNLNDTVDVSVPANATGDCKALYTKLINSAGGADGTAKLDDLYAALEKAVPANLKADVETLRSAFVTYQNAVNKAGGSAEAAADPDVQKAITALSDPKLQTAETNITAWFDKTCPELANAGDSTGDTTDATATT